MKLTSSKLPAKVLFNGQNTILGKTQGPLEELRLNFVELVHLPFVDVCLLRVSSLSWSEAHRTVFDFLGTRTVQVHSFPATLEVFLLTHTWSLHKWG